MSSALTTLVAAARVRAAAHDEPYNVDCPHLACQAKPGELCLQATPLGPRRRRSDGADGGVRFEPHGSRFQAAFAKRLDALTIRLTQP